MHRNKDFQSDLMMKKLKRLKSESFLGNPAEVEHPMRMEALSQKNDQIAKRRRGSDTEAGISTATLSFSAKATTTPVVSAVPREGFKEVKSETDFFRIDSNVRSRKQPNDIDVLSTSRPSSTSTSSTPEKTRYHHHHIHPHHYPHHQITPLSTPLPPPLLLSSSSPPYPHSFNSSSSPSPLHSSPSPSPSSSTSYDDLEEAFNISCLTNARDARMVDNPTFALQSTSLTSLNKPNSQQRQAAQRSSRPQPPSLFSPPLQVSQQPIAKKSEIEIETGEKILHSPPAVGCSNGSCGIGVTSTFDSNEETSCSRIYNRRSTLHSKPRRIKSMVSIVPVDDPLRTVGVENQESEERLLFVGVSNLIKVVESNNHEPPVQQEIEKVVKLPEIVVSVQKHSKNLRDKDESNQQVVDYSIFTTVDLKNSSTATDAWTSPDVQQTTNCTSTSTTPLYTTDDNASATPTTPATDSTVTTPAADEHFCLPCANSLISKWRRLMALVKMQMPSSRNRTKVASSIAALAWTTNDNQQMRNELQDENDGAVLVLPSPFSFIFTTSLTSAKDSLDFYDSTTFVPMNNGKPLGFDGVEGMCLNSNTNAALARLTSTVTGVLLQRQQYWHLTDYLCIGDRFCASNGQLLCQMSVTGLVILCCHDNDGCIGRSSISSSGSSAGSGSVNIDSIGFRTEAKHSFAGDHHSPAALTQRLNSQDYSNVSRYQNPSGYTHPECDSDHAIPMMPCVCVSKVGSSSERHNRSALRLNLTGSSLVEVQACFPEMNRFIDGFRRVGRRVMIVSASFPASKAFEASALSLPPTLSQAALSVYANKAFEADDDDSDQDRHAPSESKNEKAKTPSKRSNHLEPPKRKDMAENAPLAAHGLQATSSPPLPGDTLTVLAALQHLMLVDRMTFREARNVFLRVGYPLRLSKAVISLLESIEKSMILQRLRAERD